MDRGNIVWCNFDPSSGKEIQKKRPAIVISKALFSQKTGLVVVVPVTSTQRNWRTVIKIPTDLKTTGYIMAHEIKTMDIKARDIKNTGENLPNDVLSSVMGIVRAIIG